MLYESPETPGEGSPGAASVGPTGTSLDRAEIGRRLAIGGGIAMILASFLPWVKVTAPFVGTVTRSGTEAGDGWFSILLGMGVILLATVWRDKDVTFMLVTAGLAALFALYEWIDIAGDISDIEEEFVIASVGFGIYLLVLGAGTAAAGAVMITRSR